MRCGSRFVIVLYIYCQRLLFFPILHGRCGCRAAFGSFRVRAHYHCLLPAAPAFLYVWHGLGGWDLVTDSAQRYHFLPPPMPPRLPGPALYMPASRCWLLIAFITPSFVIPSGFAPPARCPSATPLPQRALQFDRYITPTCVPLTLPCLLHYVCCGWLVAVRAAFAATATCSVTELPTYHSLVLRVMTFLPAWRATDMTCGSSLLRYCLVLLCMQFTLPCLYLQHVPVFSPTDYVPLSPYYTPCLQFCTVFAGG